MKNKKKNKKKQVNKAEKAEKKKHILKKSKNFTHNEVYQILENTIELQLSDPEMISYSMELLKHCIYDKVLEYWADTYEDIQELVYIMKAIRQARYEECVLKPKNGHNVNATSLIWYGKFALNLVEYQHVLMAQSNDNNGGVGELPDTISIGWADVDE